MKLSKYNIDINEDIDSRLIFNAQTGGFAQLDVKALKILREVGEGLTTIDCLAPEDKKIAEELARGKLLVESDDIIDEMRFRHFSQVYSKNHLAMTILPTLNCNFRCKYCYENHYDINMPKEVIESIKSLVKNRIENGKISNLFVNWYGGEPLLKFDVIKELSEFFIDICDKSNCQYSAEIITNGWLLNDEIASQLTNYKVDVCQITLDGPKSIHDKYRVLANSESTFDKIVEAVKVASKYLMVSLRVNICKELGDNLHEFFDDKLVELFKLKNVSVYPARMSGDSTIVCQSVKDLCIEDRLFASKHVEFYEIATSKGLPITMMPKPSFGGCCANAVSSMVIGPDGSLYRCWSQVGEKEESYGNILNINETFKPENYYKWVFFDPFNIQECRECEIFPICVGGCPAVCVMGESKFLIYNKANKCSFYKYNLKDMLRLYYKRCTTKEHICSDCTC